MSWMDLETQKRNLKKTDEISIPIWILIDEIY
jgi:hypothetical protein